ncbi:receptor-like protein EIX2 precursor [Solanum lycopersicum]|uniref:Receptor-like protein EIX2 n=1 Tax=Solanum lycopersicum TaxID=4081 RepID=EIX2_SOLLC|nr:receptor-like protein EIX2 precursor [Solanum lycopersicum]Q6JN46.2 RecName: Full=Receptor-like protein EIX2; AltName: Full=EIX receptor 2; Flags: Precursor [Solanum lycopersicum]
MGKRTNPRHFLVTWSLLLLETAFGLTSREVNKTLCIEKERDALLEFKRGLNDDFGRLSTWGDEEECCNWKGIECDKRTGHVIVLDLHSEVTCPGHACFAPILTGKVSPSLLELEYLNFLDLSVNGFENSEIPRFIGSLKRLEYLNLSSSDFSGEIPAQFQNLTSLRILDLGNNNLIVKDLVWLSHLSSLEFLRLGGNDFQARNWFREITKVPSLKELDLSVCGLSKFVPSPADVANSSLISLSVLHLCCNEFSTSSEYSWLFNFSTSLTSIDLSHNQLSRQIDDRFGSLMYLEHLNLANNFGAEGGVPSSFGNLTRLHYLDMSNTQTYQWLPELFLRLSGSRKSLEVLGLNDNSLFGSIVNVTRFSSLKKLYLQKNMLNGFFMERVGQVSSLEYLDLSDNQMRGPLPDLALFPSLRELHLGSNQFQGRIPQGIGKLSQLRIFDVSSNRLEGLPESMGQLSNLERFDASYNVLKGTITESHFSNLSSLVDLDLSFNLLSLNTRFDWVPPFQLQFIRLPSCNMGPSFPKWLQTQNNYTLLDISLANISDMLPSWFSNLPPELKILNLSNNHISGRVSEFIVSKQDYMIIDLSSNNFSGHLPLVPANIQIFYLHKNHFSGSISSICRNTIGAATSIDLSRNQFSGEVPDCWMNMSNLAVLNLAYNNFSGKVPQSLGSLTNLEALYIRQNSFRGMLPSFSQCQLLQILDIGGNKLTGRIPAWIGTDLLQLRILSLRSNKFDGSIPSLICQLQFLQILDLSENGLSGKIPQCLNNFTILRQENGSGESMDFKVRYDYIPGSYLYIGDLLIQWKNQESEYKNALLYLKIIDLSSNKLVGGIPKEIAEMRGLRSLNLSRNDLNGTVVEGIGQMKLLESLDLSRNQLSGMIPQGLSNLTFLSVLDLSNNHLSGRIPSSTQLQSFDRSSYSGNAQLCGPPLEECPGYAPPIDRGSNTNPQEHDDDDEFSSLEFYVSMVLGFFVTFWGILGCLIVNRSWRNAYFTFLTDMKSWLHMTSRVCFARLKGKLRN